MDLPVETVSRVLHVQSHSASEIRIASADAKLHKLQRFGMQSVLVGISPDKYIEKSKVQDILLWTYLIVFYLIYVTYQIVVAVFFARNLIEIITNLYIASYLGAFFCQWAYLVWIIPTLYTDPIVLKDFQCAKSCPEFAEKAVDENLGYFRKVMMASGGWWWANILLHVLGPVVEAVLTCIRGGQVETIFILPQVFQLPMWGQIMMFCWNAVTTAGLMFYCVGSNTTMGMQVVKIKILCEILNEALENATDDTHIGDYVRDHVEIIKRARELTKQLATLNLYILTSGYLDFATQMFIVTFFDVNLSYYIATAYDMSSIFLLVALTCFMGTQITQSLESIANGSYNSKWYEGRKGLSKHVILMTQMSQNKLEQIILLGSLKVERATVLNLLRSSYAAYTVLKIFHA